MRYHLVGLTIVIIALAACASRPPEPPGVGTRVDTQVVFLPFPTGCSAAQKLGPDPAPVVTPERVAAVPHPGTDDHREKDENWLYLTGLLLEQIEVLLFRDKVEDAAYSEC